LRQLHYFFDPLGEIQPSRHSRRDRLDYNRLTHIRFARFSFGNDRIRRGATVYRAMHVCSHHGNRAVCTLSRVFLSLFSISFAADERHHETDRPEDTEQLFITSFHMTSELRDPDFMGQKPVSWILPFFEKFNCFQRFHNNPLGFPASLFLFNRRGN
jgi:hypothetical protein